MSGAKIEGWQLLLNKHLLSQINTPFQWGVNDCFLFWVGCERVMYGDSVYDDIEASYSTEEEALAVLQANECQNVFDAASLRLEEIPVNDACFGDLVGYYVKGQPALGVYTNGGFMAPASKKLVHIGKNKVSKVWRRKDA